MVDTLGSMYREQVTRRFHLLDENLAPGIRLGLHGHNNLQLAFANAQAVAALPTKRPLVVDSSVFGMGRGAGNLPTELMAQYLDRTGPGRYDVSLIFYTIDVEFEIESLSVGDQGRSATLEISAPVGFVIQEYAVDDFTRIDLDTGGEARDTATVLIGVAVSLFAVISTAALLWRRP